VVGLHWYGSSDQLMVVESQKCSAPNTFKPTSNGPVASAFAVVRSLPSDRCHNLRPFPVRLALIPPIANVPHQRLGGSLPLAELQPLGTPLLQRRREGQDACCVAQCIPSSCRRRTTSTMPMNSRSRSVRSS